MPRPTWLPVAAGAVLGVALALVVTLLQPDVYRATATVVLTRPGSAPGDDPSLGPASAAARELLASGVVAESAARNLGQGETAGELLGKTEVSSDAGSSLIDVSVDDGDRVAARRMAQELAEVFTVLYNDRFGAQARASLWDAPEARPPRVSPRPALNLALGLLLGSAGGAAVRRRLRRPVRPPIPVPVLVPVAAVEEPVAGPAPPALRVPEPEPELTPEPKPEPAVQPEPVPQPFVLPERGGWTIGDVECLLAEQGHRFPDRLAELQVYADTMRDVAGPDGSLPPGVEVVVEDVFADLIARAR